MSTVKVEKTKIKKVEKIDLNKKDPRLLSITDSEIKKGKSIQIHKDTFREQTRTVDLSLQEKVFLNAESHTLGTDRKSTKKDYKKQLPFSLIKSSEGVDFENTLSGMKIINNHLDDEAMQGPWVREFVGGYQHRRNKFNNSDKRIEAYKIEENSDGLIISQPGDSPLNYRRSAGSPCYNVANHLNGNYKNQYEIVLSNSRSANNRHIKKEGNSFLNSPLTTSNYILDLVDFKVSDRQKSSHIIVNSFSSPGPETSAPFSKDRESEEYSIYNTINYKNRNVRDVLNTLYSIPSKRFGIRSGSVDAGAFHKTHRNTRRFIGSNGNESREDNLFVNYSIPSNDFGYSWISNSSEDDVYEFLKKNSNFPYQHTFGNYLNVKSSQTINFLSQSLVDDIANPDDVRLTFSSLNFVTNYEIEDDANLKNYTSGNLNQQLINANGPYGWPSWKQIRNEQNSIVKQNIKNNKISIVFRDNEPNARVQPGTVFDYQNTVEYNSGIKNDRKIETFKEPSVSTRFHPLKASKHFFENISADGLVINNKVPDLIPQRTLKMFWESEIPFHSMMLQGTADNLVSDSVTVSMDASVQSSISRFSNEELSIKIRDKEPNFFQNQNLSKINIFLEPSNQANTIRELSYTETLYPKSVNSYINDSIERKHYSFFGWKDNRSERNLVLGSNIIYNNPLTNNDKQKIFQTASPTSVETDFVKSYFNSYDKIDLNATGSSANISNVQPIKSSKWVLDSREDFSLVPVNITASYFQSQNTFLSNRDQGKRNEGILQNDYSIFPLGYNGLRGAPPYAPIYNRRIPQVYNAETYLAGESKWEATGAINFGPFYDSYSNFSKNIKYLSQGFSLVPEFKMSNFIEDIYLSSDPDIASTPENFLDLTGSTFSTSNSEEENLSFFKSFSNSEFMKYFKPLVQNIEESHPDMYPGRLTLRCQANLKLLPYRGFYPAERAVQISEIFHRNYLHKNSYLSTYIPNDAISEDKATEYLNLRIENSKSQVIKPFFAPGVLFNSIKSGLAVDYPIFSSSVSPALSHIEANNVDVSITSFSNLNLTSATCVTGSAINSTVDNGIPRIKGSVSRRVSIEDILAPERLIDEVIYDNEPHPSASLIYGSAEWLRVLPRPAVFGNLNTLEVKEKNAIDFSITKESFSNSMRPYKSAINNFTAETIGFFLKDEKVQTHISDAVNPYLKSGITYKMRVYLNNQDVVMYDRHSAFGPPVDDGDVPITRYETQSSFTSGAAAEGTITFTGITRLSIHDSTLTLIDYDNIAKTYKFSNGNTTDPAAATATITFNIPGSSLHNSEITIRSAGSKSSKTYLFTTSTKLGSTGDLTAGKIIVQLSSSDTANGAAAKFQTALASSNGHAGSILSSFNSGNGVLTLTQSISGTTGNIAIVGSGKFNSFSGRVAGFSNGTNAVFFNTGDSDGSSNIIVQVQGSKTASALASELGVAVSGKTGHAGSISTSVVGNLLKLTLANPGILGNTRTITGTGAMTGGVISTFSGGSEQEGLSYLSQTTVTQADSHGFLPFVPPYLDPGTRPYAEISFTPPDSSNYTIPTIIENCDITYYNISASVESQSETNFTHAMSISASIDLKNYVSLYSDNFDLKEDGTRTAKKENKKYRWIIQPKWETPILDFTNSKVSALNLSSGEVTHVTGSPWKQRKMSNYSEILTNTNIPYLTASTGMWHQSGNILNDSSLKGYYLSVESGEEDFSNNKGDLASELGFIDKNVKSDKNYGAKPIKSKKLGILAKEKIISESVVAIPYYLKETNKIQLFDLNNTELAKARSYNNKIKNIFSFNLQNAKLEEEIEEIENDYLDWFDSVGHDSVSSIAYQLRMMDKYVLPPHFDFIKNEKVSPHVMYFFQFKSILNQEDLARVWQNLYPRSDSGCGNLKRSSIQKSQRNSDTQYITGFLDTSFLPKELEVKSNYENYEIFLDNNIRWLVFKVKYRSNKQLSEIKNSSIPRFAEDLESVNGILVEQALSTSVKEDIEKDLLKKYSYNWPYDYFSLIENIKMESKVDFYSRINNSSEQQESEQPIISRADEITSTGIDSEASETITQIIVSDTAAETSVLNNLVIRQEVKSDTDSLPDPANVFTIPVDPGYQIKINSESIYVNGVLQVSGTSMDYVLSGTTITFNYNIDSTDSIYITYIKE